MANTTILIDKHLKKRLDQLKIHPRESYNRVLERLVNLKEDKEELSDEAIRAIEQSLDEIKAGKTIPMTEVKRRLRVR
jgi:predicted transcriptional regulator